MKHRNRILPILLAALFVFSLAALSGCAQPLNHKEIGNHQWKWVNHSNSLEITYDDAPFATIKNNIAQVTLPNSKVLTVTLDNSGNPVSVKLNWGVELSAEDYSLMNTAFTVSLTADTTGAPSSVGWAIFLLIVVIMGLLLFLYAGRLVNSWKLGGIFSGNDTAKSLLIVKALGIVIMALGTVILLFVIF